MGSGLSSKKGDGWALPKVLDGTVGGEGNGRL